MITYTVFAPSMATLALALKHYPIERIEVITYQESIILFCKRMNIPLLVLDTLKDTSRAGLKKYKKYIDNISSSINGKNILFSSRNNFKWEEYFLKRLSISNHIYFYNIDPILPLVNFSFTRLRSRQYRKTLFNKVIFLLYFFKNYNVFEEGDDKYLLGLTLDECQSRFTKPDFLNQSYLAQNQKVILQKYKIPKADILFIDNYSKNVNSELLLKVVEIILSSTTAGVILKPHYDKQFQSSQILVDKFITIPKELPVEFLKGIPRVVMGFQSTAFLTFIDSAQIVSLIHFDNTKIHQTEKYFKEVWMKDVNNVCYPKNLDELRLCLSIKF